MDRITIIGMSPIGTSIAMRLKQAKLNNTEIVGTTGDKLVLNAVSKLEAVDRTDGNLRSAIQGANLVILDTPLSESRAIIDAISPIIEDGAVLTDTGSSKLKMIDWAQEYLPKGVSYIGGHPLVKTNVTSIQDSSPDLFENVNYCVMPSHQADQQSVKTVIGLVETLGARPLFLDAVEHDSYSVAMTHLPMVLSSAFVTATSGSESWREMYKLAASDYADFSRLASGDPEDSEIACLANPESMVHWIDETIRALYDYRNKISDRSVNLMDLFIGAWEARARWETGAVEPKSNSDLPSARDSMASAFFGDKLAKRFKSATDEEDKDSWKYSKRS